MLTRILDRLGRRLQSPFLLVVDDVHICAPASGTTDLLHTLIEHSPPLLHIIFLGRRSLAPLAEAATCHGSILRLNSRSLAFSASEIAALFNSVLQVPVTRQAVKALQKITEGWVMGLQLTARSLYDKEPEKIEQELESLQQNKEGIFNYLLLQVMAVLSPDQRESLLVLSLLDHIPVELARLMTGCESIGHVLNDMSEKNCFIRSLENNKALYILHPLFQGELRQLVHHEKDPEEIRRLYSLAASWYLEKQPDLAIRYYLAAEDFEKAEAALRQASLYFKSQHKLTALRRELAELPPDIVALHPWFGYHCGFELLGEDPPKALALLQQAHERFVQCEDHLGELLAGAQLMLFSIAIDGNYARGYPLLHRNMALLERFVESLPPLVLGHVANIAVLANTFLDFNPLLADRFFNTGLDIAKREKVVTLEIEARVARLFHLIFGGAWQRCRNELEAALPLLHNPLCNKLQQGAMFLAYMSFIKGSGDRDAYERYKNLFRRQVSASLRESSVGEAYLLFWDLQTVVAAGDEERAESTLRAASAAQGAAATPHLRNLFLQYAALMAAKAGREEEALAAVETARALREKAGGLYYYDLNDAFYGATYGFLGRDAESLCCFERALKSQSSYLRETALAFRANFYHRRGNSSAQDDLRELLGAMRAADHGHFYGWMPDIMGELLSVAVREGIEKDFARQLVEQRLDCSVLDDGTLIPLLNVSTLGTMQFRLGERVVLSDADLSETQRQVIAILLSQPIPSYPQKRLQLLLWPESDETKSRNNFDKLLSRLRKCFEAALGDDARHYLQLKHGILSLCHCRVDAHLFLQFVHRGSKHFRLGELWQAENLLHKAATLYKGEFLPSAPDNDLVARYRSELLNAYLAGTLVYAEVLLAMQQPQEAISILEQAVAADPLHDEAVKKLYSVLIIHGNPSRAQLVVERYGEALKREGYQHREIRETLDAFWD